MDNIIPADPDDSASLKVLSESDITEGLSLSTEAGWNQTEEDWQLLFQLCYGFGIVTEKDGLVGTAMAWKLSEQHAWINMVLVKVSFRGRGFARKLMETILEDIAGKGSRPLLDATKMGEHLYAKLGFKPGVSVARYFRDQTASVAPANTAVQTKDGVTFRLMKPTDIEAVSAFDRQIFGADRSKLLANFYQRLPQAAWVAQTPSGESKGFVIGRDGRFATQLGPLMAENHDDAQMLLEHALSQISGPVIIDAPEENTGWKSEIEALGFTPQRRFLRMAHMGVLLDTDWTRYFAISGPDFA
jgi:ribosomal protein S18 acetylase RimI-like enzyme